MDVFIDDLLQEFYQQCPLLLVDIGASGGPQPPWDRIGRHLKIISFDADARVSSPAPASCAGISTKYFNIGLYKQRGTLDFHRTRKQQTSSLFRPNRPFLDRFPESDRFDVLETTPIDVDTIDHQLLKEHVVDVDFIKVDAQGGELPILEGGADIISRSVFGLEIEVEFVHLYTDQPLFCDVDRFVRKFGFQLFDLRPYYWKRTAGKNFGGPKGQIIFAEALYLRDLASFGRILDRIGSPRPKQSKVLKAISICILYGYLDFALELLGMASEVLDEREFELIQSRIRRDVALSKKLPNFRGRARIASFLHKLGTAIHPGYHGWGIATGTLGNPVRVRSKTSLTGDAVPSVPPRSRASFRRNMPRESNDSQRPEVARDLKILGPSSGSN